jgi:hypothetical protein
MTPLSTFLLQMWGMLLVITSAATIAVVVATCMCGIAYVCIECAHQQMLSRERTALVCATLLVATTSFLVPELLPNAIATWLGADVVLVVLGFAASALAVSLGLCALNTEPAPPPPTTTRLALTDDSPLANDADTAISIGYIRADATTRSGKGRASTLVGAFAGLDRRAAEPLAEPLTAQQSVALIEALLANCEDYLRDCQMIVVEGSLALVVMYAIVAKCPAWHPRRLFINVARADVFTAAAPAATATTTTATTTTSPCASQPRRRPRRKIVASSPLAR